jgi:hypothetical protein
MTDMRRRAALILVVLVGATAWAGIARADGVQPAQSALFVVVVAQPDGFSDGSDGNLSTTPAGFSDGSDVPTPDGFSDGTDGVALAVPDAAALAG